MRHSFSRIMALLLAVILPLSVAGAAESGIEIVGQGPAAIEESEAIEVNEDGVSDALTLPEEAGEVGLPENAAQPGEGEPDAAANAARSSAAGVKSSQAKPLSDDDFADALISMIDRYNRSGVVSNAPVAGGEYVSARLIVKVKGKLPDLSAYNVADMIRDDDNHYLIQFYSADEAERCANDLSAAKGVVYVQPDRYVRIDGAQPPEAEANATDSSALSWGVATIGANAYAADLKRRKKTSKVVVAVVDTGVDYGHSMFKGRLVQGRDYIDGDKRAQDGNGHGTHVSGIIVDCTPGLNVKIMPVRVLDDDGVSYESSVVQGINYAVKHGAKVINLSLGTGQDGVRGRKLRDPYEDETVTKAVKKGVTVVVAAGNESQDTKYITPAGVKACITVSAVMSNKKRPSAKDWGYDDYGLPYGSNYGSAVDIAAPGDDIVSAWLGGGTAMSSGTSMATPHASAAAAMLLCDNPKMKPAAVEKKLRSAATDLGAKGWDKYYGAGLLNLKPFIQSYVVSYDANGGTGAPKKQTKYKNKKLTLSKTKPKKTRTVTFDDGMGDTAVREVSAKFTGWNTKANGKGKSYASGGKYTANKAATLYARWKNGTVGKLPAPKREGYTLEGWYTEAEGGSVVTSATAVSKDMTVYAHWTENPVSDWVEADEIPEDATIVDSKTQYRYMADEDSDWSEWSDTDDSGEEPWMFDTRELYRYRMD